MAFERYQKISTVPEKVSIWKQGLIGINRPAIFNNYMSGYQFVSLYFDKETSRIGIRLSNEKEGNFKLKHILRGGRSFFAKSFLKAHNIDFSESKQYSFKLNKESNMIVFKVKTISDEKNE